MAFRSPYPDVAIPDITVHEYLLDRADARGDHPALIDAVTGQTITYAQFAESVRRLAGAFAARGVSKGDVVALFSPNTIVFPVVFHAAAMAGATVTTVNALYTPRELADQLRDSNASLLVTVSAFLDRASAAVAQVPVREILVSDAADGYTSVAELIAQGHPAPVVEFNPAEDVVVLPYSSGTTGLPKGVMLTHRNLVANITQGESVLQIGSDGRLVAVLPFFHIYGMTVLMNSALFVGATIVVLPRFDLPQFLETIVRYRINQAYVVPPIALAFAKHPMIDSYDLSSLNKLFSGAAPLDEELTVACAKRLGCHVGQGYGMTELSPVTHAVAGDDFTAPPGSVGKALPSTQCRIVDVATGEDVEVGVAGELLIRGPQVMAGYLGRPEETAAMIDPDGWLHTGDIARIDADNYYYIVDRVKELIKYKGYQVAPAELEAELLSHAEIADAAVVGVSREGEEVPKAFVVKAQRSTLDGEAVMAYVASRVAPHKKVREVEFVEAIPRSASGKILRKDLRARG
jgi:acyl-CoA synthetase (AMP-forming)/AMP-acid ligase II